MAGRRVAILVEDDFEDVELTSPLQALKDAGAETVIVGTGKKSYRGKRGHAEVVAETTPENVHPEDIDAVLIPGGYAPDKMRLHAPVIDLVKRMHQAGKIIAAVCHGPQVLISAGLVSGRRMTSWPSVAIDLQNAGAEWVDQPLVEDGNLITSRKPADLEVFNKALIKALERTPARA